MNQGGELKTVAHYQWHSVKSTTTFINNFPARRTAILKLLKNIQEKIRALSEYLQFMH